MDAATINARIYAGRAKVAQRIGYLFKVYRPLTATAPLGNQIGTLNAAFNAGDNTYSKPNQYGHPIWFADLDGRQVRPGDYLINTTNPTDIYFIAGMQSLLPIIAIDCPRSIRITNALGSTGGIGAQGYSGICDAPGDYIDALGTLEQPSSLWPASINIGKGSQAVKGALPSSAAKDMGWQILLPPSVPITISAGMRCIDDLGRKYEIAAAELTDLGWRIAAFEAHT